MMALGPVIAQVVARGEFVAEELFHKQTGIFHADAHMDLDLVLPEKVLGHDAHPAGDHDIDPLVGQEAGIRAGLMGRRIQELHCTRPAVVHFHDRETLAVSEVGTGLSIQRGNGEGTFHWFSPVDGLLSSSSSRIRVRPQSGHFLSVHFSPRTCGILLPQPAQTQKPPALP
jgi:hypothetical protein